MIEILLPVYNGEKYLKEQIESIIAQTSTDWVLKIRNDGSSDNSQNIIDHYVKNYPDKIIEIKEPSNNLGLIGSLNRLLEAAPHGDYIMFSDQDDVWLPKKISMTLKEMTKLESENSGKPVLVCTDATCVDSNLNTTEPSFFESQKFPDDVIGDLNKMAALNVIQGCTIMINREAYNFIYPMPMNLPVHEKWLGLNCALHGAISYVHTPTLLYRQHGKNVLGSLNINYHYYLKRVGKFVSTLSVLFSLNKHLGYKLNIAKVLYFKFKYMFQRI